MIRVGTCGFSYSDWVGPFYPPGTSSGHMLQFFAERFETVELNFSFYRMPDAATLGRMRDQAPNPFQFSVKAPGELSHGLDLDTIEPFRHALEPLLSAGQLAAVLVQFPYRFKNELASRRTLAEMSRRLTGLPAVIEFRHSSWVEDAVREFLKSLGLAYCCVDMPPLHGLLPRQDWVTSPLAYVRFHGRNSAKWWEHEESWERYDYRYSDAELKEWVPRLREMERRSKQVLVYMNNHANGQATADADRLIELLKEDGEGHDASPAELEATGDEAGSAAT